VFLPTAVNGIARTTVFLKRNHSLSFLISYAALRINKKRRTLDPRGTRWQFAVSRRESSLWQ
jgi:hypothetical protein